MATRLGGRFCFSPPSDACNFTARCFAVVQVCEVVPNGCSPPAFGPSLHTCAVVYCAKWASTVLVVLRLGRLWPLAQLLGVRSGPQRGCGGVAPSAVRAHPCRFRRSLTSRRCGVRSRPQRLLSTCVWAFFAYLRGCLLCKAGPNVDVVGCGGCGWVCKVGTDADSERKLKELEDKINNGSSYDPWD